MLGLMRGAEIRKKWLCMIVIIAIILAGMFFAGAEADSMLKSSDLGPTSHSFISQTLSHNARVNVEEISGLRTASSILEEAGRLFGRPPFRHGIPVCIRVQGTSAQMLYVNFQVDFCRLDVLVSKDL